MISFYSGGGSDFAGGWWRPGVGWRATVTVTDDGGGLLIIAFACAAVVVVQLVVGRHLTWTIFRFLFSFYAPTYLSAHAQLHLCSAICISMESLYCPLTTHFRATRDAGAALPTSRFLVKVRHALAF